MWDAKEGEDLSATLRSSGVQGKTVHGEGNGVYVCVCVCDSDAH
jgi:hypothetical protein